MASITITTNPTLVTSSDTKSTTIVFDQPSLGSILAAINTAYIEVVSGTFNFNVGGAASATNGTYVGGDKLILTFGNGKSIDFKAANAAETFKISF